MNYQRPEALVDRILNADSFSYPYFNPEKTAIIKRYAEDMPSIHYVARPQLKLGGLRFNPKNYSFISNFYFKRLVYFDLKTKKDVEIPFPENTILRETLWSPDGKFLAVSTEKDFTQEVWIVSIPSLKKTKIANVELNSVISRTLDWVSGTQLLLGLRTPQQKNPIRYEKETPRGPIVQESGGVVSQNRTFPDLIKTEQDEQILSSSISMQLAIYDLKKKTLKKLGKPGLFGRVSISPSAKYLLVDTFLEPFSKVVPISLFKRKTEVWNLAGKVVHAFKPSGPFENLPIEGSPMGPRSIQWVGSEAETLFFAEALDEGNWEVKVPHRDSLFRLPILAKGKFKVEPFLQLEHRYAGFSYFDETESYYLTEYERDRRWVTVYWVKKHDGKTWSKKTLVSLNENDAYGDPGEPMMVRNHLGVPVIAIDRKDPANPAIFLKGNGATPEGDRPFLRRQNLNTLETEEWFRSKPGTFERFATFTDDSFTDFITSYESQSESPRYQMHTRDGKAPKLLYKDKNPYEIFSKIKKEVVTYTRADGVKLSGILHYPLNYEPGKKYPAIIHAYPLEYTDASTAGQVRGSQDKFSVPYHEDLIYNTLRGYFVFDEVQMPIIGHPETKNDTFIEQLVSSAKAAVDVMVSRGLVDEKRVGIIGHSYGGYMVANLLTHSNLFAAGIAKSGAYNRTLTPFGFQGERRPLWKAKETYLKMSPFLYADQLKAPILLIHGQADNNTGTFPIQSERYFDALKGQGAKARFVMLPEESHGYSSIESISHVLYEVFTWFDRYLKA